MINGDKAFLRGYVYKGQWLFGVAMLALGVQGVRHDIPYHAIIYGLDESFG